MFANSDHVIFLGFFFIVFLCIAAWVFLVVVSDKGCGDFGRGFGMLLEQLTRNWPDACKKKEKKEPKIPEKLKPMLNASTNRDFVIEMLKLRKETIERDGYDPMCPENATEEDKLAAAKLAASLEYLVNKYQDPNEFNKAFSKKINNNKEN